MPNNIPPFIEIASTIAHHDLGTLLYRVSGSVTYWKRDSGEIKIVDAADEDRRWAIHLANERYYGAIEARYPQALPSDGVSEVVTSRRDYERNS